MYHLLVAGDSAAWNLAAPLRAMLQALAALDDASLLTAPRPSFEFQDEGARCSVSQQHPPNCKFAHICM